ncbi:MAG: hypothetical protein HUU20_27545 [Pirellulales bacterium]|nr:hypothetical protein [Pirellulales bacterium]
MSAGWPRTLLKSLACLAASLAFLPAARSAEPTPEQTLYWWQDEIRTAAFALSEARTGKVAQWPQISVPAGSAVLPLPNVASPIRPDGRLDEAAWQKATRFPVGPVFDQWRQGPLLLTVRACRSGDTAYVAIQSPRDLTGLGALTQDAELFAVNGKPYHVGPNGSLPDGSVGPDGVGQVIELAVPGKGEIGLSFAVETLRRPGGRLPPASKSLGFDRLAVPSPSRNDRQPWLWLEPVQVRLVASDLAVQMESPRQAGPMRFIAKVIATDREPVAAEQELQSCGDSGVYRYQWQTTIGQQELHAEGFWYAEPVAAEIAKIEREGSVVLAQATSSDVGRGRRELYCRARQARALEQLRALDAPLLFVKQHPYFAGHIYDDFYTWQMLEIIRYTQAEALARPRVDMPGAEIVPGECRLQSPMPVPASPPALAAQLRGDCAVELSWQRTAATIGLMYEVHRGPSARFAPDASTQIGLTTAGKFIDPEPPAGQQHYALLLTSGTRRSAPVWTSVEVAPPSPPDKPGGVSAEAMPGKVTLRWNGPVAPGVRYRISRSDDGSAGPVQLNPEPLTSLTYTDVTGEPGKTYRYVVCAVNRRGQAGPESDPIEAASLPEIREPVFVVDFAKGLRAERLGSGPVEGRLHGAAKAADGTLVTGAGGFATFEHAPGLEIDKAFSVECRVWIEREAPMPVIACCGAYNAAGWFLQRYGGGWRWHLGGVSCDGGHPSVGRWTHLVGTYDGRKAHLYQDGRLVGSADGYPNQATWQGPLVLGQYSHQSPSYQVEGKIRELRIYHRALQPEEVAQRAKNDAPQNDG